MSVKRTRPGYQLDVGAGKQRLYVVRRCGLSQGFEEAAFISLLLRGKKTAE
ncbi:hypothetical protein [Spirosoma utsteinense]|nr:hypothetical protein [Spirosoma utsteinense]